MDIKARLEAKAKELQLQLENWAKSELLLGFGETLQVEIKICQESPVKVEIEFQSRLKKGDFTLTSEKMLEGDFDLLFEKSSIFTTQQVNLLRLLKDSDNGPASTTSITSYSVMCDMNARLRKAGLNYRISVTGSYAREKSWFDKRIQFFHAKHVRFR